MTREELDKILSADRETEHLEFKEISGSISILGKDEKGRENIKSLYGYCVALGNEGGGKLVLGVTDKINSKSGKRDISGTNAIQNLQDAREQIYEKLGRRIEIEEIQMENGKVQIVTIPAHPLGEPFDFYGLYLMRNGERLVKMDTGTLAKIINEGKPDYSALENEKASFADLDEKAIELLKQKWIEKSGNKDLEKLSHRAILEKLLLVTSNKITNACLLLVGKEEVLALLIPTSEIFLEWRLDDNKAEYDRRDTIREPYILMQDKIWDFVNSRNTRVPFKKGFFELDIWAYDEQSIREAVLNAFAHREYANRTEPIYVRVSPNKVAVKSPGGFLPGVNPENILDIEGKWRNRLLMDALAIVGLVERAGIGLDRIFKTAISQGKGSPDFNGTTNDYVILNIPAKIKDLNFVYYLQKIEKEKHMQIDEVKDFIDLEKIRTEGRIENKEKLSYFYKSGIVEKIGRSRGQKYILSKNFYDFIDQRGEYTRKKWLSKEQQKEVLMNYFRQHKKGQKADFVKLFENKLNDKQIFTLLDELRSDEMIYFDGLQRSPKGLWRIAKE